jgi:hypothetical protein
MRALEAFLLETLGAHAAAGDWTKRERTEAGEFVDSLMRGNGLPPKTIPKTIEADVKWTFAKGCKKLNIPNNTVVGQQQPWYTTVYNKVRVNK